MNFSSRAVSLVTALLLFLIAASTAQAHTNSVGFDLVDEGDGSCTLEWYYGSWHTGSLSPEGAFSLYLLEEGGDPADVNDYTVEAYGSGGQIRNETNFFTWSGKDTANITLPEDIERDGGSNFYQQDGSTNTDIEDAGFQPGANYFFTDDGGDTLTDISGQNNQTYSHQSSTVENVQAGTYRGFYDGQGAWDAVQPPPSTPAITATFEPEPAIQEGLVTVASGCRVFFGAVPTILIESFVGDNGFSTNDFVASTRSGSITGSVDSANTDTTTLTVSFGGTAFALTDPELELNGDDWTLALPGPLEATSHEVIASVQNNDELSVSDTITLKIVAASVESISEDDGLSQTDFRTSDTTLLIRGLFSASSASALTVEFNGVLHTLGGGAPQDALLTNSGDDWVLDFTGTALATGMHTVTAQAIEGGEASTAMQDIEIVEAPALPTFVSISDDTGTGGDFITEDDTLVLEGTFEASESATFTILLGGITYSLADSPLLTNDGDNWTLDLQSRSLGQGSFTAEATATNAGGWPSTSQQEIFVVAAGDNDGDGLPNDEDPFPNARTETGMDPVTLETTPESTNSSCSIDEASFDPDAPHPDPDSLITPLGRAVSFELSGCTIGETITVSIDFGDAFPERSQVYKVTAEDGWSDPIDAVIDGSVITYSITDGGELDLDGTANGVIVDPISTAVPPVPDSDGDGLPDDEDPFPNAVTETGGTGEDPVTLETAPGSMDSSCSIDEASFDPDAPHPDPDSLITPLGRAVSFKLSGCTIGETITVSIDFGDPFPERSQVHKVTTEDGWSDPIDAVIDGSVITYSITDGGALDLDGTANGTIVDPISTAVPPAAEPGPGTAEPIPALSPRLLVLLSLLMGLLVFFHRGRLGA